jgi:hypothetical protein
MATPIFPQTPMSIPTQNLTTPNSLKQKHQTPNSINKTHNLPTQSSKNKA